MQGCFRKKASVLRMDDGRMGHYCEASHGARLDELLLFRAGQVPPALPDSASSDLPPQLLAERNVCRPLISYCLKRSPRILLHESLLFLPSWWIRYMLYYSLARQST